MKTVLRLVICVVASIVTAEARAESGSVWSVDQSGRLSGQLGTWERRGGVALYQGLGSANVLEVDLQQPLANAPMLIPVFVAYARQPTRRPSNFFTPGRPMVGPPGSAYGQRPNPFDSQRVPRGELALDLRTQNSQSIDGLWRPVEAASRTRIGATIPPVVGAWQPVRIVFAPASPPPGRYRFTPHAF